jgi:hypothetical protein
MTRRDVLLKTGGGFGALALCGMLEGASSRDQRAIAETFAALGTLCDQLDDGERW